MKRVYTLLACILLVPKLVCAQYYITLSKENTFHYKNSYLIDIPMSFLRSNLFIQDPKRLIPTRVYSHMYLNEAMNRFDTIFISRIAQVGKNGLKKNILKKNIIPYFLGRYNINNPTDTLGDADDRFKNYKALSKSSLLSNQKSVLIYFEEDSGSGNSQDNLYSRNPLHDFINAFEKKHHVKIGKSFGVSGGHEGDAEIFLTLSGLSPELKLQFIIERKLSLLSSKLKKGKDYPLEIYTPFLMEYSNLIQTQ